MSCVIDLYHWRHASRPLCHPAGVTLPLENPGDANLFIPQIRQAVANGSYCADLVRALPTAVPAGTGVLAIGSGLGILSTLTARIPGVARLLVIEPNISVANYISCVHEANGAPWVETMNGVPVEGGRGRVPVFVRRDVRALSLDPDDGPWRQVMLVPGVNLNLVLAEEQFSLIVAEDGASVAIILAGADLASVDRMVLGVRDAAGGSMDALGSSVAAGGYKARCIGAAMIFTRGDLNLVRPERRTASV